MTVDQRLRAAGEDTRAAFVALTPPPLRRRRGALRIGVIGFAVAATLLFVTVWLTRGTESDTVATTPAGIEIVQTDRAPDPMFDVSGIGPEVTVEPVDPTDASVVAEIETVIGRNFPGESPFRVEVIGRVGGPDGPLAGIVYTDGQVTSESGTLIDVRKRCVWIEDQGSHCSGESIDSTGDPDALPGPGRDTPAPSFNTGPGYLDLDPLPASTSVVALTINGETRWQQPFGLVAVFPTNLSEGDTLTYEFFNREGASLLALTAQVSNLEPGDSSDQEGLTQAQIDAVYANAVNNNGWTDVEPEVWADLAMDACSQGAWDHEINAALASEFLSDNGWADRAGADQLGGIIWLNLNVACHDLIPEGATPPPGSLGGSGG